jgi:opacity protein-like surface antigen
MNCIKLLVTSVILLFSAHSFALGLYVEPGVFYEFGNNEVDWPSPLSSSTGSTRGLGVDVKLGIHFDSILFVGADASYSKVKFKNSASDYDADGTSTAYGVIVGGQMPVLGLRGWVGYIFDGTLDPEDSGTYDAKFEQGTGYKLGVGFKLFIVSINLEYMELKYGKSKLEKPTSEDFDSDLKNKVGMLNVSFPFTF